MFAIKTVVFLCILLLYICAICDGAKRVKRIVGGMMAAPPPPDDPVVFAKLYSRNARVEGFRNSRTGLYSFMGIHFAHPPIGNDRFRRPRYKRLEGDINATIYGQPCPQPDSAGYIVGSEDCLWLNVFTPQMPDESTGIPVLVWIHGGGYRYGSANQYNADSLTSKGVIFVPIQYRLGTLGILGDGTTEFSGNAALFDMAAAIRWVSEYIQFFGGDAKQITVIGHGSGASAATYLTTSRVPREMISGVVAMSGSPYTQYAIDDTPEQSVKEIATINKCPATNETEIVRCLRAKNFKDIIREDSKVQIERLQGNQIVRSMTGNVGYGPVVEQPANERSLPGFLEENPQEVIKNGTFKKVPLLTGVTRDETANGILLKDIENIFKSATGFLNAIASTVQLDGLVGNLVGGLLPGVEKTLSLTDYLKVSDTLNVGQILSKVTEATTDALFNLPALLTAQTWSKVAPAYLYSFEYAGKTKTSGSTFLNGLPLVANDKKTDDKIAHGDELAYLFDARDIFGVPHKNAGLTNETDKKVRDIFSNLVTKFAYINSNKGAKNKGSFQEFKKDGSDFIRIGKEDTIDKDFRFCQLSLWGAMIKPSSKDVSCKFIVDQLASTLLGTTANLTNALTGTLGGLNLLGGNGNSASNKNNNGLLGILGSGNRKQNTRDGGGGGGLLGLG